VNAASSGVGSFTHRIKHDRISVGIKNASNTPMLANSGGNAMLLLTRRLGETIVIDGDVAITVIGLKGERIRLGITAPKEVTVDRQETHNRRLEFRSEEPVILQEGSVSDE
jgi:carbon storage regulator